MLPSVARLLVLAVAIVAAGCAVTQSVGMSASCEDVPSGACSEQMALVTAGLANVVEVNVKCADATNCTRAGGHGIAMIRLANGQQLNRAWSYNGDPAPPPAPICVGVPPAQCASTAKDEMEQISPSKRIVKVTVTCTSGSCVPAAGDAKVQIVLGDGSMVETNTGWSSG
jgi:hypothetical protein